MAVRGLGSARLQSKTARLVLAVAIGLAFAGSTPSPVWSQGVQPAVLSAAELVNISNAVTAAIAAAKAGQQAGASQAELDNAVAQAIATAIENAIAQYGAANATAITDAAIVAASGNGVSIASMGQGLALAALAEGVTVGAAIASEVGSVAPAAVIAQFAAAAQGRGGNLGNQFASIANSSLEIAQGPAQGAAPLALAAGPNAGGGQSIAGGNAGPGSPCPNPSCS